MTSQNSYTEPSRASSAPLFLNTLRRKWTTAFLIAIIMFFVFPVPILVVETEFLRHRNSHRGTYRNARAPALEDKRQAVSDELPDKKCGGKEFAIYVNTPRKADFPLSLSDCPRRKMDDR